MMLVSGTVAERRIVHFYIQVKQHLYIINTYQSDDSGKNKFQFRLERVPNREYLSLRIVAIFVDYPAACMTGQVQALNPFAYTYIWRVKKL